MKTKSVRGFEWLKGGKKFEGIEKVFNDMWCYYDFYLEKAEDLPYWSTEMALVGNMAIASACAGFPAALEFLQNKPKLKSRKRADLWMGFSKDRTMLVEAKCKWLSQLSDITANKVNQSLDDADWQLDDFLKGVTDRERPTHLMSILFLQIYVSERDLKGFSKRTIEESLKSIHRSGKINGQIPFLAHYFLIDSKEIKKHRDEDYKKSFYPGVIILGRIRAFEKST